MGWNLLTALFWNERKPRLTLASVTLNSLRMYWGMLYSAMGSTTKYWYLAERSAGQYWWHFSCVRGTTKEDLKLESLHFLWV